MESNLKSNSNTKFSQDNLESELGTKPVGQLLFKLAMPCICAQIVNMLYNIVDSMFIGNIPNIGDDALTGVGVTFPIIMLISAFSSLIGMGGSPRVSIAMGQQKNDEAEKILTNCFTALVAVSIILTVVFSLFSEPLLMKFGAEKDTISYALEYLSIYILGTIFVQISLGMNGFITAQGKARFAMATVCIGAVINIILDPILIFGFNMGVKGAAIATVCSQMISAIWVIVFFNSKYTNLRMRKEYIKPEAKVLTPCIILGLAPFVMQSTESLLAITFNVSLLKYGGKTAVGAMTIIARLNQILAMPIMGLAQGAQPILSYNYGACNVERMKKLVKISATSAIIFSLLFWVSVMFIPNQMVSLFNSENAELMEKTVWAMRIYFAVGFVMGMQSIFQQSFVALSEAKISLFLALLRKIILLIPLIIILPYFFEDKVFAVFVAEPISDFIAVSITSITFFIRFRKILKQTEEKSKNIKN